MESYVVPPPVVRVAVLTGVERVSIGADAGVLVRPLEPATEAAVQVMRASFLPRAAGTTPAPRFRLQLASLHDEEAARTVANRVENGLGLPAVVRWSDDTKTYQVRAGSWNSRDEANGEAPRFRPLGFDRPWVVEEAQPAPSGGFLQLVETGREMGPVAIAPVRGDQFLSVDGSLYRGRLEVRPDDAGGLTVVNVLNLEDYVRGVVPNELSPVVYPQLEALKAQAVAARTYAIRNRGQFAAKGYDICATPACQVYRGKSSEHPLTDRAVEETAGLVAWWNGAPINALYTSTCGGHTEDGANIFEGSQEPYLVGVACLPERSSWANVSTTRTPQRLGLEGGLARDVALLVALGAIDGKLYASRALEARATDEELRGWTARTISALGRRACPASTSRPVTRRAAYFRHLVDAFCWEERAHRLLSPDDPDYLLQLDDRAALTASDERLAAALLLQEGVISPYEDNTLRPERLVTRGEALQALSRVAARVGSPRIHSGLFKTLDDFSLTVSTQGEQTETFPMARDLWLFRAFDGTRLGTGNLSLMAGDKLSFVLDQDHVSFLEAEQSRLGVAADRTSRYFRWETRLTPDEVAHSIERYGSVGKVTDLVPRRTGVSGRVVELTVTGTQGDLILRGLKIRWGLGLRENLFVVDRERRASGEIARFVFTGKGWGHGVGLCQVGAFGMAASGATFEQILQHYYHGVSLQKLRS
jgi:stage II sporulation protein D